MQYVGWPKRLVRRSSTCPAKLKDRRSKSEGGSVPTNQKMMGTARSAPLPSLGVDDLMNGAAMPHDIVMRDDELPERRIDVVEIDVGNEAVDAGIDAGRALAMHIALLRDQSGERREIGEPARHGGVGIVAADALIVIALEVERLRLRQPLFRQAGMLAQQRVAERRPVAFVLPARIRHH